ncbi:MAG TPA: SMC family ATPase, partial [Thermoplasmata archaeon]|nr:SMC family ATPase [Thermoplasmata archaeon]
MILKSLMVTNFRKFKHVEIDFPDGVVGVLGLNGVGKSTLFEAVAWALYGPVAARTSADRIKRDGASPSESCRVTVEFLFNENIYKVIREMTGKTLSSFAVVTMNGKIAAQGAEAATKFIQKLFGMDAKSFFTSLFAKQKELNTLSTMYASERKQLILRMLGIDALDKTIKNVRSDIRKTRDLIEHYNASLKDELTGRLKKEVYREQIIEKEKKIKEVDRVLHEKKEKIAFIEKKLKAAEENKWLTQKKYEEMQRKLEEIRKIKELHERRKRLEKEIEKL